MEKGGVEVVVRRGERKGKEKEAKGVTPFPPFTSCFSHCLLMFPYILYR